MNIQSRYEKRFYANQTQVKTPQELLFKAQYLAARKEIERLQNQAEVPLSYTNAIVLHKNAPS